MPEYKISKSQKRSKSQSKNGGRRRKHTMRKLRRGKKSRKVMMGGGVITDSDSLDKYLLSNQNIRTKVFNAFGVNEIDEGISALFKQMTIKYRGYPIPTSQMVTQPGPINSNPELKEFFSKL